MSRLLCCAISALVLLCCSDDTEPRLDAAPGEGGVPDQAAPDGPVSACDPALDLSPLTLDGAYCVTRRFELPAQSDAVGLLGETVYLFNLNTGSGGVKGHVQRAAIDPQSGTLGTLVQVFSFTPASTGTLFAGAYLALSPSAFAAVGYTEDQTFAGEIHWGDEGIKTPKLVDKANGNFDVVFLDDSTLLINGTGVGAAQDGQGVYLYQEGKTPRRLIEQMGVASGFMALGESVIFAGGYFSSGSKIYGFSLAEVKAAISGGTTLSSAADGDLVHEGSAGDATALGDDLVLTTLDSSWQFQSVARVPVTVSGDALTVGTAADMVTPPAGSAATTVSALVAVGGNQVGLVLQGSAKTELVIVEQK